MKEHRQKLDLALEKIQWIAFGTTGMAGINVLEVAVHQARKHEHGRLGKYVRLIII